MKSKNCLLKGVTYFLMIILTALAGLSSLDAVKNNFASADIVQVGTYEDLESGLSNIYEKFGQYQREETTPSDETMSVAAFDTSYTEPNASGNLYTNRIIVYYNGKVPTYNTKYYAEGLGWHIYQYESQTETDDAYRYYSSLGYLDSVEYDYVVTATEDNGIEIAASTSATGYASWGAAYTGIAEYNTYLKAMFLNKNTNKLELEDVVVAIIDTGINTRHAWFDGGARIHENSKSFINGSDIEDDNGHGTHVAGIIANQTPSNVKLLVLKTLDGEGNGSSTATVQAIEYVRSLVRDNILKNKNEKFLINMSLGIESQDGKVVHSAIEGAIVKAREDYGILSVVAAGNGGKDQLGDNTIYCSPANTDEAIVIAALYRSGDTLFRDSYSNWGSTVDFAAPGTSIKSAYIGGVNPTTSTAYLSGTSMATPHASAVIALLYSNPKYSKYGCDQIEELLADNAKPIEKKVTTSTSEKDQYTGYGCINIANIDSEIEGSIIFNVSDSTGSSTKDVTLTYSKAASLQNGQVAKIMYTLNYDVPNSKEGGSTREYKTSEGPIHILSTTRITAVAYVFTEDTLVAKSEVGIQDVIIDNIDLDINYDLEFDMLHNYYYIARYHGKLETLSIPSVISTQKIMAIGNYAFQGTKVKNVTLPDTVVDLGSYAFYNVDSLQSISGNGVGTIGAYCFSGNTALAEANFPYVEDIRTHAFNNCENLTEFNANYARSIDINAFRNVQLDRFVVGGIIDYFSGIQEGFSVDELYAYTGLNEELDIFYNSIANTITSTNTEVVENIASTYVLRVNETASFDFLVKNYCTVMCSMTLKDTTDPQADMKKCVNFIGFDDDSVDNGYTKFFIDLNTTYTDEQGMKQSLKEGEYQYFLIVTNLFGYFNLNKSESVASFFANVGGMENKLDLYVDYLLDKYVSGDLDSNYCKLILSNVLVLDEDTPAHNIDIAVLDETEKEYKVYVDGALADASFKFYDGIEYDITVTTDAGYYFKELVVGGYTIETSAKESSCSFKLKIVGGQVFIDGTLKGQTLIDEVSVKAGTGKMEKLDITLTHDDGLNVSYSTDSGKTKENFFNSSTVEFTQGQNVKFYITADKSYSVNEVFVNGEKVELDSDNSFEISNVAIPYTINITASVIKWVVTIKYGNGGIISSQGYDSHDEERHEYKINVISGNLLDLHFIGERNLVVDSITVNDMIVNLDEDNSLTLSVESDIEVVVSFKEAKRVIFGSDEKTVISFFIVSLVILTIWISGKVGLYLYRKNKKKKSMHKA